MAALVQGIDASLLPEYLKTFLEWSQKKRQERLAKQEQKRSEDQKAAQSRAARMSIATPLRQINATQRTNLPYATPSAKAIESRIQVNPIVTPMRDELVTKWRNTDASKTPTAKKAVRIIASVDGKPVTPSRVPVNSRVVDKRIVENDIDDLEMTQLANLIEKRRVEAAEMAVDDRIEDARAALLKLQEEDVRAPAHGKWWVARAQIEEYAKNFNEVVKLLEEANNSVTKDQYVIKVALNSFIQRRIQEAEEMEELDNLLPSPSGKSPRTPDEASDAPLVRGLSSLSIQSQPAANTESAEFVIQKSVSSVETVPTVTITEEEISATPSTPTRVGSPRRLPSAVLQAMTRAIDNAKEEEKVVVVKPEPGVPSTVPTTVTSTPSKNVITIPTPTGTPSKKIPSAKALAVFAAAALAEHDIEENSDVSANTSASSAACSSTSSSKRSYIDDYEDIFAAAKKTLAKFGLRTTYQPIVPKVRKNKKNAANPNQQNKPAVTPVAMKVSRRLVHGPHRSPSKGLAIVTPVRRSIRLERAASHALNKMGIHVQQTPSKHLKKEVIEIEDDNEDVEEKENNYSSDEEEDDEVEEVLMYPNPHIKLENL